MSRIKPPPGFRLHRVLRDTGGITFEPPLPADGIGKMRVRLAGHWVAATALPPSFMVTDARWLATPDKRRKE